MFAVVPQVHHSAAVLFMPKASPRRSYDPSADPLGLPDTSGRQKTQTAVWAQLYAQKIPQRRPEPTGVCEQRGEWAAQRENTAPAARWYPVVTHLYTMRSGNAGTRRRGGGSRRLCRCLFKQRRCAENSVHRYIPAQYKQRYVDPARCYISGVCLRPMLREVLQNAASVTRSAVWAVPPTTFDGTHVLICSDSTAFECKTSA